MKIALVHDWFINPGGSEKVVRNILGLLRQHDVELFALMDFFREDDRQYFLEGKRVHTTFLQHAPLARNKYRYYLPLFAQAVQQLDMSGFDCVISSSHSVAKGVRTHEDQPHLCYCHTPMRYLWDMRKTYMSDHRLDRGWRRWVSRPVLNSLRKWDFRTAADVDYFVANSENVKERIRRNYHREAEVVYPPVDTLFYQPYSDKEDFYVTASRIVPYKRVELIVDAFLEMPGRRLVVIGDGPNYEAVKRRCKGTNVEIIRFDTREVLRYYLQRAKAFVFAAEEDFGITPVEAQACGTPVIALGRGGALETVVAGETGIFFRHQTVKDIIDAVYGFENLEVPLKASRCRQNAERFSKQVFQKGFSQMLKKHLNIECSV